MLRDGQFIKEPPIKIGAHHVPFAQTSPTKEDEFVQHLILNSRPIATTKSARLMDIILILLIIWLGIGIIVPALKLFVTYFIA